MDVRKWLEGTADRAPPDDSHHSGIPQPFHTGRDEPDRVGRTYRHKRKRPSTESSIVKPRPAKHRDAHAPIPCASSDHIRDAVSADAGSRCNESSHTSRAISDHPPGRTYDKRARHKTRHDRYEPKVKKPKKERDARRESKSKPKRRNSHRTGDGGRTGGLVQSFQLKNGPKKNRLTVSLHGDRVLQWSLTGVSAQTGRIGRSLQTRARIGANGRPGWWMYVL